MFLCDKCGLCCLQVNRVQIYAQLDRGDGVCRFFDEKTKLCTIYDSRPVICNVDRMYDLFFATEMERDEYYKINYESCKKMKEEKQEE